MPSSNKKDIARSILESANFWISNVDTKVSFILGLAGVFLGFLFADDSITESVHNYIIVLREMNLKEAETLLSFAAIILFGVTIYFITRATYQLVKALQGRVDMNIVKQPGLRKNSSIFWGTISSLDYESFKKTFDDSEEQQLNDLQSQAYVNSLITKVKFKHYNSGLTNLKRGITAFVFFELLTYFSM